MLCPGLASNHIKLDSDDTFLLCLLNQIEFSFIDKPGPFALLYAEYNKSWSPEALQRYSLKEHTRKIYPPPPPHVSIFKSVEVSRMGHWCPGL